MSSRQEEWIGHFTGNHCTFHVGGIIFYRQWQSSFPIGILKPSSLMTNQPGQRFTNSWNVCNILRGSVLSSSNLIVSASWWCDEEWLSSLPKLYWDWSSFLLPEPCVNQQTIELIVAVFFVDEPQSKIVNHSTGTISIRNWLIQQYSRL